MTPIIEEVNINAPAAVVWQAITDKAQMKEWYFDIAEFEPEPGFKFDFYGECEGVQYLHICEVKEVIPNKKLSYTWRYEQTQGTTLVTYELFEKGNTTMVRLTHEGVELFADHGKDFQRECFEAGWKDFMQRALKDYVEKINV